MSVGVLCKKLKNKLLECYKRRDNYNETVLVISSNNIQCLTLCDVFEHFITAISHLYLIRSFPNTYMLLI